MEEFQNLILMQNWEEIKSSMLICLNGQKVESRIFYENFIKNLKNHYHYNFFLSFYLSNKSFLETRNKI